MHLPDPNRPFPIADDPHTGFLKNFVSAPYIEIGDFTYYDDPDGPAVFQRKCVLHHWDLLGDRLIIGRFTALATGVRFMMSGANHPLDSVSGYPFDVFGDAWSAEFDIASLLPLARGDLTVGNDVWIGTGATILPGVRIGTSSWIARGLMGPSFVPCALMSLTGHLCWRSPALHQV